MKFLVPNYSCLQNPWLGGYAPRFPFSLSSTEFVEPPPEKTPGFATDCRLSLASNNRAVMWAVGQWAAKRIRTEPKCGFCLTLRAFPSDVLGYREQSKKEVNYIPAVKELWRCRKDSCDVTVFHVTWRSVFTFTLPTDAIGVSEPSVCLYQAARCHVLQGSYIRK